MMASCTVYEYNNDNYLTKTRAKDNTGGTLHWRDTSYAYTPAGLIHTVTDPQGNVTTTDYDGAERVAMVTDAAGRKTRTFYFADGKARKVLKAYQYAYNNSNEACSVSGTDQQCYARYTYTDNGQQATIQDANGNTTTYAYDSHDRLDTVTYPDSSYEQFTYDGNGNILTKRNRAGEVVTNTYDALSRLSTKSSSTFPNVAYGYDLLSRQTSVNQTGGQSISWVYDKAGRVTSTTAGSRTVSYQYDADGNRTRLTWPDSFYVTYSYDDANRMDLVKENGSTTLADYSYDSMSRRTGLSRSNGDNTAYTFEADSDLASITHNGLPGTAPVFSYSRNGVHQILSETVNLATLMWQPPTNENVSYVHNTLNQYSSVGGVSQSYDQKGNLTGDGTWTFTYDAENRLKTASKSGSSVSYSYDGIGRRISKTVNSTTTDYLLDGNEEIAEYSGSTLLRRYVYGPSVDDRILRYEGSGVAASNERFYYANQQNSTVMTVDGNGAITDTFTYSPYGESSVSSGEPFRYTGRRLDDETGLYYYRARYYSPKLGRFLQTDPMANFDDLNRNVYVRNDPVNRVDNMGLWSTRAHNLMINTALSSKLSANDLNIVRQGSAWTDSSDNQATDRSYMHSMRGPGQSAASALAQRDAFIKNNLDFARQLAKEGKLDEALFVFGEAIHTQMDSTSPEHVDENGDPIEWKTLDFWSHGWGDLFGDRPGCGECVNDVTDGILQTNVATILHSYTYVFGNRSTRVPRIIIEPIPPKQ